MKTSQNNISTKIPHRFAEPLDRGNTSSSPYLGGVRRTGVPLGGAEERGGGIARRKSAGFSLVELIVVITIIGILSITAISGYRGFTESARDAVRVSHLNTISQLFEEYAKKTAHYPTPDNTVSITWSGATAWYQGTVGDTLATTIGLSPKLKDPIYNAEYAYSITANGKQYQLASVSEGSSLIAFSDLSPVIPRVLASSPVSAIVRGTYNQVMVSASSSDGTTTFVAAPSLILSSLSETNLALTGSFSTGAFVVNARKNLPASYSGTTTKPSGDFYFTPTRLRTIAGSLSTTDLTMIMEQAKLAYSDSVLLTSADGTIIDTIWKTIATTASGSDAQTAIAKGILWPISWGAYSLTTGATATLCSVWYIWNATTSTCDPNVFTVSGSFGALGSGATVSVCGSNVTADASGNFSRSSIPSATACNNITATRTGYNCTTSVNGPASLTATVSNIAGSCTINQTYVDDVFSTYLYTGNGGSQTINNGIDLAGHEGMVWMKSRNNSGYNHWLIDTVKDTYISSSQWGGTEVGYPDTSNLFTPNSNGFTNNQEGGQTNANTDPMISWTFRKAPKFFDVVTWTGNGVAGRQIPHDLGITPGMVIVKSTSLASTSWPVWHRGVSSGNYLLLESANAQTTTVAPQIFGNGVSVVDPTSTNFTVGGAGAINQSGQSYVAYIFAHDTSTDGIIQAGSYIGNGISGTDVPLDFEPQFFMVKSVNGSSGGGWLMYDTMRGFPVTQDVKELYANYPNSEATTGFVSLSPSTRWVRVYGATSSINESGKTYIYLAIRRPNKPPTSGLQVYNAITRNGTSSAATITGVGFAPDLLLTRDKTSYASTDYFALSRLTSPSNRLILNGTNVEGSSGLGAFTENGYTIATSYGATNDSAGNYINHFFKRAPGFFDIVAYTGNGSARTISHNLGVMPQLIMVKKRASTSENWCIQPMDATKYIEFTISGSSPGSGPWNNTAGTSSVFSVGNFSGSNETGSTYIAYLFATLPNISKVGSYVGNGGTLPINAGFDSTARFILIKKTDTVGGVNGWDWYVWDSTRGIVAGNDPHLSLNTTAGEATGDDSVDPDATGFAVNQNTTTNINVTGATYIYLAIH